MAILDTIGFYIIRGFVSRAQLIVQGYNIKNLPVQSDMNNGRRWLRPGNEADIVKPAALVNSISGIRRAYGPSIFKWPMVNLSPRMVRFLQTDLFDGGWYAELTVQTFNRATGDWEAYQVTGQFPDLTEQAEAVAGGYSNFQIQFVNALAAPDGPDLRITVTGSAYFQVNITSEWTINVANIGDAATFANTVVNHAFPANINFKTYSVDASWTPTWSSNGTTYYDFIANPPPVPAIDVRYIRFTYALELNPTDSTPPILIQVVPSLEGQATNVFTVSTGGDIDSANDTATVIVTVILSAFTSGFDSGFGVSLSGFGLGFDSGFGSTPSAFDLGFAMTAFGVTVPAPMLTGFSSGFDSGFGNTITNQAWDYGFAQSAFGL